MRTPCQTCEEITRSVRVGQASFLCEGCGSDKTFSDVVFYQSLIDEWFRLEKFNKSSSSSYGMKVVCNKCGHEWTYKGRLGVCTCPSCRRIVKVKQ
jgi:hypothetical protein